MTTDYARHVPDSHPVVRRDGERVKRIVAKHAAAIRVALSQLEEDQQANTETLESIARAVAHLRDVPLSNDQRSMARLIRDEMHRLSRDEQDRDHYYKSPAAEATRRRYDAIAAAVNANPERRLRIIAEQFGVSTQLVSKIAITRGIRRRMRRATNTDQRDGS